MTTGMALKNSKKACLAKKKVYTVLTNPVFSDKNYEHILNAWETFKLNNMKDYHNLHFKVDFLLLVCLSKNESITSFAIDPAHYLSAPGYSWDVMENTMRDENHNKRWCFYVF